jgi:DNA-binding MarR family transcriptional regulator
MGRPPVPTSRTAANGKPDARKLDTRKLDRGLLPSLLGYVLRRTQSAVFGDFAATFARAEEALTPGEFGLLVLVERNAGLSQMALARAFGIDRSTLVPILDRLQARGLLMRHRSPTDGRTHALELTAEGSSALARFTRLVRAHEKRIAGRLTSAELATLIALLDKVHRSARS